MLKKLSALEKFFFVENEFKRKQAVWSLVYMVFLILYICFWVSYFDINQYVTYGLFFVLALFTFIDSSILTRLKLAVLLVLASPIVNTLLFTIDSKLIRIGLLLILTFFFLFVSGKELFKVSRLLIVINIIFCLTLIPVYYLTKFHSNYTENPPIAELISDQDTGKDIYMILLDAFPAKEVLKDYFSMDSQLQHFLIQKGFREYTHLTNYNFTDQSLPNLFSGTRFTNGTTFRVKDISEMRKLIPGRYLSQLSKKYGYQLNFQTLLLDPDNNHTKLYFGSGSDFNIYLFPIIDRFLSYLHFYKYSSNEEIDMQLENSLKNLQIDLLKDGKKISFFHFLTFHGIHYDVDSKTQTQRELLKADKVGIAAVKMILSNNPEAKIIVISDHGIRFPAIKTEDNYKGILYIKN